MGFLSTVYSWLVVAVYTFTSTAVGGSRVRDVLTVDNWTKWLLLVVDSEVAKQTIWSE